MAKKKDELSVLNEWITGNSKTIKFVKKYEQIIIAKKTENAFHLYENATIIKESIFGQYKGCFTKDEILKIIISFDYKEYYDPMLA